MSLSKDIALKHSVYTASILTFCVLGDRKCNASDLTVWVTSRDSGFGTLIGCRSEPPGFRFVRSHHSFCRCCPRLNSRSACLELLDKMVCTFLLILISPMRFFIPVVDPRRNKEGALASTLESRHAPTDQRATDWRCLTRVKYIE